MRLLVVSDYYMYECDGKYYFESQEKCDFFHRYLRVFESVKLATRCIKETTPKNTRILLNDSRIDYIPIPDFHGPKEYLKSYFAVARSVSSLPDDCDAAILQLPSTVAMHASRYVIKSGIPYATEVVYDAEDGWRSETSPVKRFLWKRIDNKMRKICAGADGVACVTEHYLQKHYFSFKDNAFKSHYSSLALDKSFYSGKRQYPYGRTLTIAHTANKIFYEGRKGHKESIEAIALLKRQGVVVNIKFAGAFVDDSPQRLKDYANQLGVGQQIQFVGFINRQQLDDFLTDADLFVLPTKAEGLPRVLIEAMAKGLPCVTTKVSGNSELVSEDFLVSYSDIEGLAEKIKIIVTDKSNYENQSEINYNKSLSYEASILQQRRDAFYSQLKKTQKNDKSKE